MLSTIVGVVGAAPTDLPHGGVLWRGCAGRFWMEIPEVARYLVEDGQRLTVEPFEGADPEEVARFAASTPAAAAYLQRGLPVLHAGVAVGPKGAIVLAGDSSAGKSILLEALLSRRWAIVSDDMAPLSISPGSFQVLAAEPLDITAIWLLATSNERNVKVTDITGAARFRRLNGAAYNSRISAALLDRRANFAALSGLAASAIPIRALSRPRKGRTVEELADIVMTAEKDTP